MHAHWEQQIVDDRVQGAQRAIRGRARRVDQKLVGYSKGQHVPVLKLRMKMISMTTTRTRLSNARETIIQTSCHRIAVLIEEHVLILTGTSIMTSAVVIIVVIVQD